MMLPLPFLDSCPVTYRLLGVDRPYLGTNQGSRDITADYFVLSYRLARPRLDE